MLDQRPALGIDDSCMLAIKGCGPIGYPVLVNGEHAAADLLKEGIRTLPTMRDRRQSGIGQSSILNGPGRRRGASLLETAEVGGFKRMPGGPAGFGRGIGQAERISSRRRFDADPRRRRLPGLCWTRHRWLP